MGNCIYCGQKVGFLRKIHKECNEKHQSGKKEIINLISNDILVTSNNEDVDSRIERITSGSFIDKSKIKDLIVLGWESALNNALDDNFLSSEEEEKLANAKDKWKLNQEDLDSRNSYTRFVQSSVLRDVLEGKIPEKVKTTGQLPFNFLKDEKLVWVFQDVKYYEQKTRRQYVGGSQGVSMRIARGLYYRVGAFKGEPVFSTETVHVDTGILGITNKHIYFSGNAKSFRIKYGKIVSFVPYSDGMGIQRDAATAKPQSFVVGDGWFIYNLVTNLANLSI